MLLFGLKVGFATKKTSARPPYHVRIAWRCQCFHGHRFFPYRGICSSTKAGDLSSGSNSGADFIKAYEFSWMIARIKMESSIIIKIHGRKTKKRASFVSKLVDTEENQEPEGRKPKTAPIVFIERMKANLQQQVEGEKSSIPLSKFLSDLYASCGLNLRTSLYHCFYGGFWLYL